MSYTDLSGVFYVQQQYLTDLSALSTGTDVSTYVSTLQTQLTDTYDKYGAANISSTAVLDHQAQMNTIIKAENDRLNVKKIKVDDALFAQQGLVAFNDSYRKKYRTQIDILIIVVIALSIYYYNYYNYFQSSMLLSSLLLKATHGCLIVVSWEAVMIVK
jgi:hypothetical protein